MESNLKSKGIFGVVRNIKIKETKIETRKKTKIETRKAYDALYHQNNKEKIKERKKLYYINNKEKILKKSNDYYKKIQDIIKN